MGEVRKLKCLPQRNKVADVCYLFSTAPSFGKHSINATSLFHIIHFSLGRRLICFFLFNAFHLNQENLFTIKKTTKAHGKKIQRFKKVLITTTVLIFT